MVRWRIFCLAENLTRQFAIQNQFFRLRTFAMLQKSLRPIKITYNSKLKKEKGKYVAISRIFCLKTARGSDPTRPLGRGPASNFVNMRDTSWVYGKNTSLRSIAMRDTWVYGMNTSLRAIVVFVARWERSFAIHGDLQSTEASSDKP